MLTQLLDVRHCRCDSSVPHCLSLSTLQKIAFMVALGLVTTEHMEGALLPTGPCVTDTPYKLSLSLVYFCCCGRNPDQTAGEEEKKYG